MGISDISLCCTGDPRLSYCVLVYLFSTLSLWGAMKKKPLVTVRDAHGSVGSEVSGSRPHVEEENWITAVAALHNSDLLASGNESLSFRVVQD